MNKKIFYGKQSISKNDIKAVIKVLNSDFITQGPNILKFEENLKNFVGAKHAVLTNSATSSLIIACKALDVGKKDVVWTSANTFVSSANCALHCGAKIDLIDIEPNTGNMCLEDLSKRLFEAKNKNKLPKVIIPVHFAGQPTDQKEIWKLSKKYGFRIIEDASHSLGASRENQKVGNCKWSDIVVSSFHPVKTITSGEGGVNFTNNANLSKRMQALRTHGIYKNLKKDKQNWHFDQKELGYNFRITDIQSALGISQLKRIKSFINKRKKICLFYDRYFKKESSVHPLELKRSNNSTYHLYVVKLSLKKRGIRNQLLKFLQQKGIILNTHYIPIHYHSYFKNIKYMRKRLKNVENYYDKAISLPVYPDLTLKQQKYVLRCINLFLKDKG